MADSYAISGLLGHHSFLWFVQQSGHTHKGKNNNNNENARPHPVLAASEAWFCCWKRTVAAAQLEELFQGTGNALAVNELFFARMSDSSCAPVNSLLLPWETKPVPSEELKEVSQGSPVGAAPSGATATGAWPINHHSSKFIIPALSVYLRRAQEDQCQWGPLPTPLNCSSVRFSLASWRVQLGFLVFILSLT